MHLETKHMAFTYADYIESVMGEYQKKQSEGSLPLNLEVPTPSKLKKACILRCSKPFDRRDEKILIDFFDPEGSDKPLAVLIGRSDRDKFKPLSNYLKGETSSTDEKNIHLLAFLIDFRPRPYVFGMQQPKPDEYEIITDEESKDISQENKDDIQVKNDPGVFVEIENAAPTPEQETTIAKQGSNHTTENQNKVATRRRRFRKAIILILIGVTFLGYYLLNNEDGVDQTGITSRDSMVMPAWNSAISPIVNPTSSVRREQFSLRCQEITKAGTQCKRNATNQGYCWQHDNK
jgi:hypothetical protein